MVGRNKMKDWKASVRTWERNNKQNQQQSVNQESKNGFHNFEQRDYDFAELEQRLAGRHV
jgi:hypothetical protein